MEVTSVKLWKSKSGSGKGPIATGVVEFDQVLQVRIAVFHSKSTDGYFISYPSTKLNDKYYDDVKLINSAFAKKVYRTIAAEVDKIVNAKQSSIEDAPGPQAEVEQMAQAASAPAPEVTEEEIPF